MSSCAGSWPEERLSSDTCTMGKELLQLLTAQVHTFYYLGGGKANSVIQEPANEAQRILDILGQLFVSNTTEEVSEDDDSRPNQHCSPSPAETLSS